MYGGLRSTIVANEPAPGTTTTPVHRLYGTCRMREARVLVPIRYEDGTFRGAVDTEQWRVLNRIEFGGPLIFEDVPYWASWFLRADMTTTTESSLTRWVATGPMTSNRVATATWDWAQGSLITLRSPFTVGQEWTISGEATRTGLVRIAGTFLGQTAAPVAVGSSTRTTRTGSVAGRGRVWLNGTDAPFGTTRVGRQVLGYNVTIRQASQLVYPPDRTTYVDFDAGQRSITGTVRWRFASRAEVDNWLSAVPRRLRLMCRGANFQPGWGSQNWATSRWGGPRSPLQHRQWLQLDVGIVWTDVRLGQQGNVVTAEAQFRSRFDEALGSDVRLEVSTTTAVLNAA